MSPELRAMLEEQEKYNRSINAMLDVLPHFPPRDTDELVLWSDELARVDLPCEDRPAIFGEEK